MRAIYSEIRERGLHPVWISLVDEETNLDRLCQLELNGGAHLPLFGIPFAVKDNFDVAGMATTAACIAYSRDVEETAEPVKRLLNAGAILIGKTNMDQFATGLVGTRTPFGICSSVFHPEYISGGSSSGSAVAVASGLVSFSLGTDTAGSGRVPAAFNQLVGLKPTRGLVSTRGLLAACRSLDCVSIFAETSSDAAEILRVIQGPDTGDMNSRSARPGEGATPWSTTTFRFGVPSEDSLEFFGDDAARACYHRAIEAVASLGGEAVRFDYTPFREVAELLYRGPWVAERLHAIREFVAKTPDARGVMDPTVAKIILDAASLTAMDAFAGQYALGELRQKTDGVMSIVDFLLLPTAPTIYRISEVQARPIELNNNLGYYTNFVNLLDMAAVAVPAGLRADGLPFGISLIGRAFSDIGLIQAGDRLHRLLATKLGGSERALEATPPIVPAISAPGCLLMAVVGAHLTGQPLNWQMTTRHSRLVRTTRTRRDYRLFVLPDTTPPKPGLVQASNFEGQGIEVEIWAMPKDTIGSFLAGIPRPLCLGTIQLEDGSSVKGFLCEPSGLEGAKEITHLGGWRSYLSWLQNS